MKNMQSQHNDIRKPFDPVLYANTIVKTEWIHKIFPILKIIPKQKEDFGIDSYWVRYSRKDLGNLKSNEIIAGIEWEKANSSSWSTYRFPYSTASFLTRKDHYANLGFPAFFIRINSEESNAYVMRIDEITLNPSYVKEIKRSSNSIAREGETRFLIPEELMVFGFENIEPFLVYELAKKYNVERANKMFKIYRAKKNDLGRPILDDFYTQIRTRKEFLKNKGE